MHSDSGIQTQLNKILHASMYKRKIKLCTHFGIHTRTDNLWLGRPPRVRRNSVDGPLFAFSKNHDKSTENSFFTH